MFKNNFRFALLSLAITFATSFSSLAALPSATLDALHLISSRSGTTRLDFNQNTHSWSLYDHTLREKITCILSPKNRFDMINPIENLTSELEESASLILGEPDTFHAIRRAYSSLSALYSYYKINPNTDAVKQADFIGRYANVLVRLKLLLTDIKGTLPSHTPQGWFLEGDMSATALRNLNDTLDEIGNHYTKIDRAAKFYPTEGNTQFRSASKIRATKKLVIFVVHGTFAADAPEYTSDKNAVFQQTRYMAQSLANDQNAPVELYSFGWSGANSDEARMRAGEELANFVQTYFPAEEYHDIFVGHSHGGNVIFHLAKTMREYRTPYMVVTLATPIRKDFITDNINYLFQFYTNTDWVQIMGSYEVTLRNSTGTGTYNQSARMVTRQDMDSLGLFKHNDRYNDVKIYAVHTKLNNHELEGRLQSHTHMKHLIGALPRLLDTLIQYRANSTFVMNVDLDAKPVSVNEMDNLRFQIVKTGEQK